MERTNAIYRIEKAIKRNVYAWTYIEYVHYVHYYHIYVSYIQYIYMWNMYTPRRLQS